AGLDEQAADTPPDDLLLDELQGLVGLAVEPVGGEDQEDLDGLARQGGPEPIQARPAVRGPADGRVVVDELAGNEDPQGDGGLEQRADLVQDRVLELRAVARVDAPTARACSRGRRAWNSAASRSMSRSYWSRSRERSAAARERGDPVCWCVVM